MMPPVLPKRVATFSRSKMDETADGSQREAVEALLIKQMEREMTRMVYKAIRRSRAWLALSAFFNLRR